jgi:hypothetical protein
MKNLNLFFIAIFSLFIISCENSEEISPVIQNVNFNPNFKLVESETSYSLNEIIDKNSISNIDEIIKINVYFEFKDNSKLTFFNSYSVNNNPDDFVLKINHNEIIENKYQIPENVYIEIVNNKYQTISNYISFEYTGNYLNDYINYHFNEYPLNIDNFPLNQIVVDDFLNIYDYRSYLDFNHEISFLNISFYDDEMNKLYSNVEYFNDYNQYPYFQFGINKSQFDKYKPSFYEIDFVHSIDEIQEVFSICKLIFPVVEQ